MGIIDGTPLAANQQLAAEREADTLFTCVFLGLLADGFEHGWPMRWDVEPEADPDRTAQNLKDLGDILQPLGNHVAAALRKAGRLPGDAHVDVGTSPAHWYTLARDGLAPDDGEAVFLGIRADRDITTGHRPRQQRSTSPELQDYILEHFVGDLSLAPGNDPVSDYQALLRSKTDGEFGAYYGIVDHPENFPPKVLSSVRRLIPYASEYARWRRGTAYHGLIGYEQTPPPRDWPSSPKQAGSIEPTRMIADWDGADCVCGYCHGMNWAVAQAACMYPPGRDGAGGIPFELGLGKNTLKLASCFGCTTFMYANGLAPSSAHLGRAESWVPLPEDEDSAGVFFNENEHTRDVAAIQATFKALNQRWADKVSTWMLSGAELIAGEPMFQGWARAYVVQLKDHAQQLHAAIVGAPGEGGPGAEARYHRMVANLFLDALTIHRKDIDRLRGIVS